MKVLIVERSRLQQTVLSRIFSGEGLIVSMANSFNEALDRLQREKIDFLCISFNLDEGKTGIELTQEVRKQEKYTEIPVMLLTSPDKNVSTQLAFDSGVTEITCRSNVEALTLKIKSILGRRIRTISAHILYVEDSKTAATLTMRDLKEYNVKFDHFLNADDAFAAYQQNHSGYDMIITDVVVEGKLDGLSFVQAIREITPENYKMPILAVSGFDDTSRRVELLRSGANDYIVKPYVKEELLVRVQNLITTKRLFDQVALQQEELYQQAMKDHLTGLHNRHAMDALLPKISSAAKRHEKPLSILFFDIDHFKNINDTHGHIIGDNVLEQMGQMISCNFRKEDFCVRYGGEEFVVILYDTTFENTCHIAEKFRNFVETTPFSGLDVRVSIGTITVTVTQETNMHELLGKADKALYEAKEGGRNRVCSVNLT